ncbi:MAG: LPS export ABC transporter ATP-binding protein [Actinomycetia bacterium]|nr:LPS export ABC transporter ATP-binding protein [Actinomycetes bacterium]
MKKKQRDAKSLSPDKNVTSYGRIQLRMCNLVKVYGKNKVVNEVNFIVNQGEIVGLLGPNGAGKTTTFYMTVGLIKPTAGKVFLNDDDITRFPMYLRARRGIGYLPQEESVFRKLSVEDNFNAILEMIKDKDGEYLSKDEIKKRREQIIRDFDIERIRKQKGYSLSGGERRRTEIARALLSEPKFILLDEPFSGIDPIAVKEIQKIVIKLKKRNIGVLITDHNVRETLTITERAYIMNKGVVLISGTADELINNSEARKIYLGEDFRM